MSVVTCTRRLTFEAGHRVKGHENKCAHLHGHSYKVHIEAFAPVDDIGRVIDFSVLKQRVGGWIDEHWDHAFLVAPDDTRLLVFLRAFDVDTGRLAGIDTSLETRPSRTYVLPYNPTAENLADYLLTEVCPKVLHGTGVVVTRVIVHETENCYAEACSP